MDNIKLPRKQHCEVYNINSMGVLVETVTAVAEMCDDLTFGGDGLTLVHVNDVLFAMKHADVDLHTEETRELQKLFSMMTLTENTYIGF